MPKAKITKQDMVENTEKGILRSHGYKSSSEIAQRLNKEFPEITAQHIRYYGSIDNYTKDHEPIEGYKVPVTHPRRKFEYWFLESEVRNFIKNNGCLDPPETWRGQRVTSKTPVERSKDAAEINRYITLEKGTELIGSGAWVHLAKAVEITGISTTSITNSIKLGLLNSYRIDRSEGPLAINLKELWIFSNGFYDKNPNRVKPYTETPERLCEVQGVKAIEDKRNLLEKEVTMDANKKSNLTATDIEKIETEGNFTNTVAHEFKETSNRVLLDRLVNDPLYEKKEASFKALLVSYLLAAYTRYSEHNYFTSTEIVKYLKQNQGHSNAYTNLLVEMGLLHRVKAKCLRYYLDTVEGRAAYEEAVRDDQGMKGKQVKEASTKKPIPDRLRSLKALRDDGIIEEDEFQEKRQELMSQL